VRGTARPPRLQIARSTRSSSADMTESEDSPPSSGVALTAEKFEAFSATARRQAVATVAGGDGCGPPANTSGARLTEQATLPTRTD
jgi:hypothetical protein